MGRLPPLRIRLRWAAPAGAVVAAAAVLAGTMLASAAAPSLPRRTPAQLLAGIAHAKLPAAMSATVTQSANFGFPALPDIGGLSSSPLSAASLISGTRAFEIWYAGPQHVRIALPVPFGETDLRVNGSQVWLWNSGTQTATHILPPAASHFMLPGRAAFGRQGGRPEPAPAPMTPLQAAKRLLALIGPTTRLTVPGTTVVAGRDAYQLAIAPRSSRSLVGRILIAIDARTHLPLSLAVYARGSSSPAFRIGFTSLSFARPAASNFKFTPPPGAHIKTIRLPGLGGGVAPGVHVGWSGQPPAAAGPKAPARIFGTGWLTVAAIPAGPAIAGASGHVAAGGNAAFHSTLTIKGPAGRELALLRLLLKAARPVHGTWGSGRLLRTSLVSVLLTSKGELLVGAVTPAVLYADAAKVS